MNKNILYGLVFIVLFFSLILPNIINPTRGFIFTIDEWAILLLFFLCILLFRNPIAKIIKKLNQTYSWGSALKKRMLAQTAIVLLGASIMSTILFSFTSYYLENYGIPTFYQKILDKEEEINRIDDELKITNDQAYNDWQRSDILALIAQFCFFALLLIFLVEEIYGYLHLQAQKKLELETLQKEQAQLKASVLGKQLDPHFMFNTLNVLSGLIYQDVDKSAQFIKELSKVYRYVLERSEELVSTLEQEFQFLESYMYLLKFRFDDKIPITIDIPDNRKNWYLPSMTLELLVENAIKHNIVDSERPLHLNLCVKDDQLIVKNNLQPRNKIKTSLGLGLKNLKKRLELLGQKNYSFAVVENEFIAIIPLINPEDV